MAAADSRNAVCSPTAATSGPARASPIGPTSATHRVVGAHSRQRLPRHVDLQRREPQHAHQLERHPQREARR